MKMAPVRACRMRRFAPNIAQKRLGIWLCARTRQRSSRSIGIKGGMGRYSTVKEEQTEKEKGERNGRGEGGRGKEDAILLRADFPPTPVDACFFLSTICLCVTYALCMTMSTPYFIGFSSCGLANVASTTVSLSLWWPPCSSSSSSSSSWEPSWPNFSMSRTVMIGLLGVSAYSNYEPNVTCSVQATAGRIYKQYGVLTV